MDTKIGKNFLIKEDFEQHPIWKFDEEDSLIYPVCRDEDFPDNSYDLLIKAVITTKKGRIFNGYIVGVKHLYCVAIFVNNVEFIFNKNLLVDCIKDLKKLSELLGEEITVEDFSPLKYTTDIDLEGFKNISGEFNLSKKRTIDEQLWQANE